MDSNVTRPPIISVLGHVDHGKTSLLDKIRQANVAAGESGGITQHIGAYQVERSGRLLTFIDTPGHAAFSAMRARGGQASDLAILVVAADDGVMPQTRESIQHIRNAAIPFVVAVNKIDLERANLDKVKMDLANEGVLVEGFGGNIPICPVSAKSGQGIEELLDVLLLLADLEELKGDANAPVEAIVIESSLDRHRGPVATVIVKNGSLDVGDQLYTDKDSKPSKVKALLDWQGNQIKSASPSTPALILGFTSVPPVGAFVTETGLVDAQTHATHEVNEEDVRFSVILRADVAGTLEAIIGSLPKEVKIIGSDTGPVNESDVTLAQTTGARIICFRVKPSPAAKKLAEIENIRIDSFTTIYDLLDTIKENVDTILESEKAPPPTGQARVLQLFDYNGKAIIGCRVFEGKVKKRDKVRVMRGTELVGEAYITSIRVGREDKDEVIPPTECGLMLSESIDIRPDDTVLSEAKI
jgi:translation initiation factor IF-2